MDQPSKSARTSFWTTICASDGSPVSVLIQYVTGAAALLAGGALFFHNPLPLIPAGVLVYALRAYHLRFREDGRVTVEQPVHAEAVLK